MTEKMAMTWLRRASVIAIVGLLLILWSILDPTPVPIILSMSLGQALGALSFLVYVGVVVLEFRTRYLAAVKGKSKTDEIL